MNDRWVALEGTPLFCKYDCFKVHGQTGGSDFVTVSAINIVLNKINSLLLAIDHRQTPLSGGFCILKILRQCNSRLACHVHGSIGQTSNHYSLMKKKNHCRSGKEMTHGMFHLLQSLQNISGEPVLYCKLDITSWESRSKCRGEEE